MRETLTLIEKTAFLSQLPALAGVPTEALAQLGSQAQEIHYDAGAPLFAEGDPNTGVVLVVDGLVELRKGKSLVRMLGPGQTFGELFAKQGEGHVYTAVASLHTHVLKISLDNVFDAMLEYPEFAVGMVRGLATRNDELIQRLLALEDLLARFHQQLRDAGIEPTAELAHLTEGLIPQRAQGLDAPEREPADPAPVQREGRRAAADDDA